MTWVFQQVGKQDVVGKCERTELVLKKKCYQLNNGAEKIHLFWVLRAEEVILY